MDRQLTGGHQTHHNGRAGGGGLDQHRGQNPHHQTSLLAWPGTFLANSFTQFGRGRCFFLDLERLSSWSFFLVLKDVYINAFGTSPDKNFVDMFGALIF